MRVFRRLFASVSGLTLACASAIAAAPPTIEAFVSGAKVEQVSISPDGQYLALIIAQDGRRFVAVNDRRHPEVTKHVAEARAKDGFAPRWCRWAKAKRLLCSFAGLGTQAGHYYPVTRLVSLNADGTDLRVLTNARQTGGAQFEDGVLDWMPRDPRIVLIQVDEGAARGDATMDVIGGGPDGYPDVYALDVFTGERRRVLREHVPIERFITDGRGNIRLGVGYQQDKIIQFARFEGDDTWHELSRVKAFESVQGFDPFAVVPDSNFAYAFANKDGRQAVWKIDLTDKRDPELLFSHPDVDVDDPLFSADGRLLGIAYDAERPGAYYSDAHAAAAYAALRNALPGHSIVIVDATPDDLTYVVRAERDDTPPFFLLLTLKPGGAALEVLARSAPGLVGTALATKNFVTFKARDGTKIPGYLTLPVASATNVKPPLIVLPHGGPQARDSWGFDAWSQFLASRGYAVLQVEFRGSSGYGEAYWRAGFRDWGGLPYTDVVDGVRWALAEGYADHSRVCIVGGSYGGYLAELAATRNEDGLFRCAASIAGVSDLVELRRESRFFRHWEIANASLASDGKVLKEQSPRTHAAQVNIPLLLIHGDRDYTVDVEHTKMMDAALSRAGKPHRTVYIEGADHHFREEAHQRKLYEELAAFLDASLKP